MRDCDIPLSTIRRIAIDAGCVYDDNWCVWFPTKACAAKARRRLWAKHGAVCISSPKLRQESEDRIQNDDIVSEDGSVHRKADGKSPNGFNFWFIVFVIAYVAVFAFAGWTWGCWIVGNAK